MSTKKILLTGFHPFAHFESNPTEYLARKLNGKVYGDFLIKGVVLPVSYQKTPESLKYYLETFDPDIVVSTGLASDRTQISLELVAINLLNAKTSDNDGMTKSFEKICDGENAYFSTLPLKDILLTLQKENIPSHISLSAGSFVCNQTFYYLMEWAQKKSNKRCGFIHYPANLSTEVLIKSTELILHQISK